MTRQTARSQRNAYLGAFGVIYMLAVFSLVATDVYSPAEPLFMLAIFGLLLPGVALLLSRRCHPLPSRVELQRYEVPAVFVLVAFVIVYLVWGGRWFDNAVYSWVDQTPRLDFFLDIAKKLVVFVLVPYLVLSRGFGYRWRDFGFTRDWRKALASPYLAMMIVFFALYFAIQFLVGQAAQPVFRGDFSTGAVIIGGILTYAVLVFEVGLVEEFFFRAVLQARMAAWLNSETGGLLLMALIFGLAHAPGLYLREAGAATALGSTPGLVSVLAYSVAVLSLAGLAFGVIWMKTRNIYVLVLIHAWVDTLPSLPEFIAIFDLH